MSVPDQYMFVHSTGNVECKVCLSIHTNVTAYLSHAQGKLHKTNVERYYAKPHEQYASKPEAKKTHKKASVGIPKYNIIKIRSTEGNRLGFRAEFQLNKLTQSTEPQFRIMSSYEQNVEEFNTEYQYLVVAADPYETVAVRMPSRTIKSENIVSHYDPKKQKYYVQVLFESD